MTRTSFDALQFCANNPLSVPEIEELEKGCIASIVYSRGNEDLSDAQREEAIQGALLILRMIAEIRKARGIWDVGRTSAVAANDEFDDYTVCDEDMPVRGKKWRTS